MLRHPLVLVLAACAAPVALAQEIDPRAYSPSPTGATFFALAYTRSTGAILTDPSLPVDDVEAEINAGAAGVGHTFGLFGRLASAAVALPYVRGHFTGTLEGEPAEATRSGTGDLRIRLSTNLVGNPALSLKEFAQRKPSTIVGASLVISAPTGQYDPDRLINVGTNRWAFKPEIGVFHPIGNWLLEGSIGVWLFGDNDNYFGGRFREQDPLASMQAHVSYTFRPRLWVALNGTFYDGGRTTVDGVAGANRQSNSRAGLTLSLPVGRRQSVRLNWSKGATARIGSDFTNYGVAWQYTLVN
jgi:hypothetical protein